jgi:hypothetical protein
MRFSLRTLLLAMPVVALGISGFVFNLAWATSLIYTFSVVAILLAAIGALFARGDRRLFWAGFAAFGWGYWFFAFEHETPKPTVPTAYSGIPIYTNSAPFYAESQGRFITSVVLDWLTEHMPLSKRKGSRVMAQWGNSYWPATIIESQGESYLVQWADGSAPSSTTRVVPYPFTSRIAGHSLFCLLFALIGGAAAVWLLSERRESTNNAAATRAAPAHE